MSFDFKAATESYRYRFELTPIHDTSASAPMRRSEIIEDHQNLRGDAANIALFLLNLRNYIVGIKI